MRVGARRHALIAARALLEVQDQQALRLHQALVQEIGDRDLLRRLDPLAVHVGPLARHRLEPLTDVREARQHQLEVFTGDPDDVDVVERRARRRAGAAAEQAHLTEERAAPEIHEDDVAAGMPLGDLHETEADEIKRVGGVSLPDDHFTRRAANELDAVAEVFNEVLRHRRQHRHAPEMCLERALAVVGLELRPERLVLLQDVEDVPQHLQDDDLGLRADGGRPRMKAHARHLAEELPCAQLGERPVVWKIDRRVDRDEPADALFGARVLDAARELAADAADPSGRPAARPVLLLHVRDGAADVGLDHARENVKGGRPEVPFATDDLARRDDAPDDRPLVQLQEGPRHALEHRQLQDRLGIEELAFDHSVDDPLVRQRAGRARHHALAARDARRAAHRVVEVEPMRRIAAALRPMTMFFLMSSQRAAASHGCTPRDRQRYSATSRRAHAARAAARTAAPSRRPPSPSTPARSRRCSAAARRGTGGPPSASRPACYAPSRRRRCRSRLSSPARIRGCRTRDRHGRRRRRRRHGTRRRAPGSAGGRASECESRSAGRRRRSSSLSGRRRRGHRWRA